MKYTAGKDAAVQSGLVIIGEEEMDDYGDSVVPLFTAYPQREPILAEGGEVNVLSNWQADGNGGLGLLGMVNYGLSGKVGITGRFSSLDVDNVLETNSEFTISPSYMVTENWGLIAEAKFISDGAGDPAQFALESLISFQKYVMGRRRSQGSPVYIERNW